MPAASSKPSLHRKHKYTMFKSFLEETVLSLSRQQLEWLGRTVAVSVGSIFSPSWHLLKDTLSRYVDVNRLLAEHPGPQACFDLVMQLQAHGPQELMFSLMPSLAGCMLVSLAFMALCSFAGQLAGRRLARRYALVR